MTDQTAEEVLAGVLAEHAYRGSYLSYCTCERVRFANHQERMSHWGGIAELHRAHLAATQVAALTAAGLLGGEVAEVGAYGRAMEEISLMRNRFARESQEHAQKAREVRRLTGQLAERDETIRRVTALADGWDHGKGDKAVIGRGRTMRDLRAALAPAPLDAREGEEA